MRGEGEFAELIRQRFALACRRAASRAGATSCSIRRSSRRRATRRRRATCSDRVSRRSHRVFKHARNDEPRVAGSGVPLVAASVSCARDAPRTRRCEQQYQHQRGEHSVAERRRRDRGRRRPPPPPTVTGAVGPVPATLPAPRIRASPGSCTCPPTDDTVTPKWSVARAARRPLRTGPAQVSTCPRDRRIGRRHAAARTRRVREARRQRVGDRIQRRVGASDC